MPTFAGTKRVIGESSVRMRMRDFCASNG